MSKTAKVFKTGRSQAVRLPLEFRFDSDEVFIRKDLITGDVILSNKPRDWSDLFQQIKSTDVPDDFMSERDQDALVEKDLF